MIGRTVIRKRTISAVTLSFYAALFVTPVLASPGDGVRPSVKIVQQLQEADARDYRHCHHMGRRAYCHVSDRLPRNWPPHSETPAERKSDPEQKVRMPTYLR
jgi:hypothetical protein